MAERKIVMGIVAHVDAGKTTLSEAMLYNSGKIRNLGRVDHKNSFLDNNTIERDRGITVFSKQAVFEFSKTRFTLLDTPGHADFGAEAERTLSVLDYAVLVISAPEGVQSHTRTLWQLLEKYNVPTVIFVNKTDICSFSNDEIIGNIRSRLSENCFEYCSITDDSNAEALAMCSETLMDEYLAQGISQDTIHHEIKKRNVFPVFFGSALKNIGIEEFMQNFEALSIPLSQSTADFGAKVFKISFDERGTRLTHIKITSGTLKVKNIIQCGDSEEKVDEIRIYSADKYEMAQCVSCGDVCALTGLDSTSSGMGLGCESDVDSLTLESVFAYTVNLPDTISATDGYQIFKKLAEEETGLNATWNEKTQKISVTLMGEVQTEVLTHLVKERFGFDVSFEKDSVVYKETILDTVEGVGHYEPLRHYAEVHLILEPGKKGSGITFDTRCKEDEPALNWQRLILTHLAEKTHIGVLTGSPITDIHITLAAGRAHLKHTDGGDFRQATYRAVRHGLANAKSVLLEPWYDAIFEVPAQCIGRVMNDISGMGGNFAPPETFEDTSVLRASAPVEKLQFYAKELVSFTRGLGKMSCSFKGYEPCNEQNSVIENIGYDFESDVENSADSVFCSHGAACIVKWYDVYDNMHIESCLKKKEESQIETSSPRGAFNALGISQDEIDRIFEMTYGKPKEKKQVVKNRTGDSSTYKSRSHTPKEEYILVDGYNIIFAWEDMKKLAQKDINLARESLITKLVNYAAIKECNLAIVFDAYKVQGGLGNVEKINGISVVYTKEAETADAYIEKASHTLASKYSVKVATSDALEQMIIFSAGAMRIPAAEFEKEVKTIENLIDKYLSKN